MNKKEMQELINKQQKEIERLKATLQFNIRDLFNGDDEVRYENEVILELYNTYDLQDQDPEYDIVVADLYPDDLPDGYKFDIIEDFGCVTLQIVKE